MSIAADRIDRLHRLARQAAVDGDDDRSRRYVARARRVGERNRLPLPRAFERRACDRCDVYRRPGRNARVRTRDGHVVVTCACGEHARYPYGDEDEDEDEDGHGRLRASILKRGPHEPGP
jgi:ribonuclease P protein subunit RPR2